MKPAIVIKRFSKKIKALGLRRGLIVASLLLLTVVSLTAFLLTAPMQNTKTSAKPRTAQTLITPEVNAKTGQSTSAGSIQTSQNSSNATPNTKSGAPRPASGATGPQSAPASSTVTVVLTVNRGSNLNIILPVGSNMCDVLSRALQDGKLQSLDMRYDANYGSYGVYKINGQGQSSQVWWVYRVNGTSPNKGCSFVPVNNYDQIVWSYIGP